MARLTIELDMATWRRLVRRAVEERRPFVWQAEVELQRALADVPLDEGPPAEAVAGAGEEGRRCTSRS